MTDKLWHKFTGLDTLPLEGREIFFENGKGEHYTTTTPRFSYDDMKHWAYVDELIATANASTALQKKLDKAMEVIHWLEDNTYLPEPDRTRITNKTKEIEDIKE